MNNFENLMNMTLHDLAVFIIELESNSSFCDEIFCGHLKGGVCTAARRGVYPLPCGQAAENWLSADVTASQNGSMMASTPTTQENLFEASCCKCLRPKEMMVLEKYAQCNMSVGKTAKALFYSPGTINYYFSVILEKTGLNPRNFHELCELLKYEVEEVECEE